MTDFLSKYKKELKLLADYSYTGKNEKIFSNKIYWEGDKLYSTCGGAMLYMTTENNSDGFTLMEVNKGKITVVTDKKEIEKHNKLGLYKRVMDRFTTYDFSFDFVWDKDLGLPTKLFSTKSERYLDKAYFDFDKNELFCSFGDFDLDGVKITYGDLFQNMKGNKPEKFRVPAWELFNLVKAEKKNTIHCEVGKIESKILGTQYYIKMDAGKYTCIATGDN